MNENLAGKMNNPHYFTEKALQLGFNLSLDSLHINHSNSNTNIKPIFPEFGIEFRYTNKVLKEMATVYARIKNQNKFKNQTIFPLRFGKRKGENQVLDETEMFINLKSMII